VQSEPPRSFQPELDVREAQSLVAHVGAGAQIEDTIGHHDRLARVAGEHDGGLRVSVDSRVGHHVVHALPEHAAIARLQALADAGVERAERLVHREPGRAVATGTAAALGIYPVLGGGGGRRH
jgi:hypothetical protein